MTYCDVATFTVLTCGPRAVFPLSCACVPNYKDFERHALRISNCAHRCERWQLLLFSVPKNNKNSVCSQQVPDTEFSEMLLCYFETPFIKYNDLKKCPLCVDTA